MRGPTLLLALCALMLAAPALHARRPDSGSIEADEAAFRREQDRDERKIIREIVRGWTWATMPSVGADDDGSRPDDDSPRRRLVRVTALAAAPSGEAIVGAGDDVVDLSLGAGTNQLWIAGTMRVLTHGAWVHAVPW